MQNKFDVYFSGEILEGQDIQEVREAIGKIFKLSGKSLDALFSGEPRRIKKDLNVKKSGHFREVFRKAGAAVQIVPAGQKPQQTTLSNTAATSPDASSALKLAPMGSELSGQPRETEQAVPAPSPAATDLDIAPIGPIPGEPSPEPADINTGDLQAAPAASGSLEEFVVQKEPVPLPDISSLELVKEDKPIQEETSDSTDPLPETGHLEVAPAQTGSLEQFAQEKEPVPIPDISSLSLDK